MFPTRQIRFRTGSGQFRQRIRQGIGGRGRVADQRFVDGRPDVMTFVSAPLDHDIVVTGPLAAALFASTSGTDGDFVVKLIDVYPESAQKK